jgi:hypothetical protein
LVSVGSFQRHDRPGRNHLHFSGRLNGRALAPGGYVLQAIAELAGQTSRLLSASFRILAPAV